MRKTLYVEQSPGFGLGNFINLTPTIKKLSEEYHIQAWFHDDFIRQCFLDCPFMEIIGQRQHKPYLSSGMINIKNDMPDYMYVWKKVFGNTDVTEHTYVDVPYDFHQELQYDYALVINGSGSLRSEYLNSKIVPVEAYKKLTDQLSFESKVIGNRHDQLRMNSSGFSCCYPFLPSPNIRYALSALHFSKVVIANDSGLAHAAAAMNKKLYILWKDTKLPKNSNPGKNTTIIPKDQWLTFVI